MHLDAIGEAAQPSSPRHLGPTDSVVGDLDHEEPFREAALIVTEVAPACFTAFASASQATK